MRSGIAVKAARPPQKGGTPVWTDCDICDLSTEEFINWWQTIQSDDEKLYVAETLRRMTHNLSDFGDAAPP